MKNSFRFQAPLKHTKFPIYKWRFERKRPEQKKKSKNTQRNENNGKFFVIQLIVNICQKCTWYVIRSRFEYSCKLKKYIFFLDVCVSVAIRWISVGWPHIQRGTHTREPDSGIIKWILKLWTANFLHKWLPIYDIVFH